MHVFRFSRRLVSAGYQKTVLPPPPPMLCYGDIISLLSIRGARVSEMFRLPALTDSSYGGNMEVTSQFPPALYTEGIDQAGGKILKCCIVRCCLSWDFFF